MRIKVILTEPTAEVPINNQHYLNGFINAILGVDNPYHDSFSDYSISSLQGGKMTDDKKNLSFDSNPHFFVASRNEKFMSDFFLGIEKNKPSMFGMTIKAIDMFDDFKPKRYYDMAFTISPILLTNDQGRKITFKSDAGWIDVLKNNCRKKLLHQGIDDKTFDLEVLNPEGAKDKCIWVGDTFNPCSMVKLKVYGKPETRYAMYSLGFGKSTGSGFGSVKLFE